MNSNLLAGFVEELDLGTIRHPSWSLRVSPGSLEELMASISERGLLQPIVIRPMDGHFEIIAGNRRFEACRRLGFRKIAAHVLELGNREAYEASLIENIQRKTFDPIEEARAFKRYVNEYGYGSISELAAKIGKSEEYVSHRIGLLSLPSEILEKVSRRRLTPSHAAELRGLDGDQSLRFSQIIIEEHISAKEVRKIVKETQRRGEELEDGPFTYSNSATANEDNDRRTTDRIFGKCIAALKVMMIRFDTAVDNLDEKSDWAVRELLLEKRNALHQQIDDLLILKRKTQHRVQLDRGRI